MKLLLKKLTDKMFYRFIIVGIINLIVGGAIMFTLYNIFHASYWISSSVNYILTSILSFLLNKHFTFSTRHWSIYMVIAFIFNICVCYVIAYSFAKPLAYFLLKNFTLTVQENIALLVGMCIFTGLNYLGQKYIVFKKG